jgi:DNA-binding NarL/FixJ family response regulator
MSDPDLAAGAPPALRVVVADDSVLFREGLARLLSDHGFTVVGLASDADELRVAVERDRPDVVVTDIRMPPANSNDGLLAARWIRMEYPVTGVLVLSQYVETRQAMRLLQPTPRYVGYLLKDRVSDIAEFTGAVRRVAQGGSVIDPEVVARLLRRRQRDSLLDQLTSRERDILALIAEGRSNQAICARLFLSPKTVETHVRSIFTKLDLPPDAEDHRRVLAVLTYIRNLRGTVPGGHMLPGPSPPSGPGELDRHRAVAADLHRPGGAGVGTGSAGYRELRGRLILGLHALDGEGARAQLDRSELQDRRRIGRRGHLEFELHGTEDRPARMPGRAQRGVQRAALAQPARHALLVQPGRLVHRRREMPGRGGQRRMPGRGRRRRRCR